MRTPLELLESRYNSMLDKYELIMVSKYGNGNINSLLCVKNFNSEKKQVLENAGVSPGMIEQIHNQTDEGENTVRDYNHYEQPVDRDH